MSKYNVEHKYSSPWRVHESMKTVAYLPGALKTLEQQMAKSLGQFYDQFTVEEWLEQHIQVNFSNEALKSKLIFWTYILDVMKDFFHCSTSNHQVFEPH